MVHIADANSMTRGAELSFISLPAASTRIKNLEQSIGARVLNRSNQGVTLTPPGQAFVTHARRVLSQIEQLRGDMQEYGRGIKCHLRVFANTTSLLDFDHVGLHESSAIHAFLQQASDQLHRPIKLRIQVGSFETACRMIEAGVGVGVLPESAASRHALSMAISSAPLADAWSLREMRICVRSLEALPSFARELVDLLVADAQGRLVLD